MTIFDPTLGFVNRSWSRVFAARTIAVQPRRSKMRWISVEGVKCMCIPLSVLNVERVTTSCRLHGSNRLASDVLVITCR